MMTRLHSPKYSGSGMALDRYIRKPEVLQLTGVSKSSLDRWVKAQRFPKPFKIGPNSIAWKESEVRLWLATRDAVSINQSNWEAK